MLVATTGAATYYGVPASLMDNFIEWFSLRMDEFVISDEFSMKNSRRKSNAQQQSQLISASSSKALNSADGAFFSLPTTSSVDSANATANNHSFAAIQSKKRGGEKIVKYDLPPHPTLPDGSPNVEGYRSWTDIIRARYPTFNRSGSHMCRIASQFCDKYKLKKVPIVALTAVRSNKPAFGLPERYHAEFLEYMEETFLHSDGTFGREDAHIQSAPGSNKKVAIIDDEENEEEVEEDEEYAGDVSVFTNGGEEDEELEEYGYDDEEHDGDESKFRRYNGNEYEEDEEEEEVIPVSSRARGLQQQQQQQLQSQQSSSRRRSISSQKQLSPPLQSDTENVVTVANAPAEWKRCLLDSQQAYLRENSKSTSLLLKIRNNVHEFIKHHSPDSIATQPDSVPNSLIDAFQAWFEVQISEGFDAGMVAFPDGVFEVDGGGTIDEQQHNGKRHARELFDNRDLLASKKLKTNLPSGSKSATLPVLAGDHNAVAPKGEPVNKIVSKSGFKLTKYNSILLKMMPEFKSLSHEARVAIKRGVKLFLQHEMGDKFAECIFTVDGADHHTYGVPQHLLVDFKHWAYGELSRGSHKVFDKLGAVVNSSFNFTKSIRNNNVGVGSVRNSARNHQPSSANGNRANEAHILEQKNITNGLQFGIRAVPLPQAQQQQQQQQQNGESIEIWEFLDAYEIRNPHWSRMPLHYQVAIYGEILMAPDWTRVHETIAYSDSMLENLMWYERWSLSPARAEKVFAALLSQPWFDASAQMNRSFRWAARLGYLRVIENLLSYHDYAAATVSSFPDCRKLNLNPADDDNYALQCAAEAGHLEIVRLLFALPAEVGIDPSGKDDYAVKRTACTGHVEVMRLLLADPRTNPAANQNEPIINSASNGHTAILEILLQNPLTNPAEYDNYAISQAAAHGHLECVKLLAADPRVNVADADNEALFVACENGNTDVVDFLLTLSAVDPSQNENEGLLAAIRKGHVEIVKLFLNCRRADVDLDLSLLLAVAIREGKQKVVQLILQDKRFKPVEGAFILADDPLVMDILLNDPRLDPSECENEAIFAAKERGNSVIISMLLKDERVVAKLTELDVKVFSMFARTSSD
ncbi:hypothetical protein HK100_003236 [Physocladia obscura]|uniref:Uncharacterized protein n=1 Tax=Physocladia obscura TaxID=109957 RepID=A0AAD5SUN9_9FUNG|nr:hypothetical protein HK100_003236 [Physocladia obscura]